MREILSYIIMCIIIFFGLAIIIVGTRGQNSSIDRTNEGDEDDYLDNPMAGDKFWIEMWKN